MDDILDKGLIEPQVLALWLEGNGPAFRIVDASYPGPGMTGDPVGIYMRKRIGDAVFFDVDVIADHASDIPHMLPKPDYFADAVGALGIGDDDLVVVYDQTGLTMAAARVWWMFRVFGHARVCVLNGGLPFWEKLQLPVTKGRPQPPEQKTFTPRFRSELVADEASLFEPHSALIIDARSPERYAGQVPEPRPGLRRGHIPGSCNIPFTSLVNSSGRLADEATLKEMLGLYNDGNKIVTYCGSGITACVPALAFFSIGMRDVAVYDGSWAEWGRETSGMPVAG